MGNKDKQKEAISEASAVDKDIEMADVDVVSKLMYQPSCMNTQSWFSRPRNPRRRRKRDSQYLLRSFRLLHNHLHQRNCWRKYIR